MANSFDEGPPLLGIDVGGSKILGGLVSRRGQVLFEHKLPTRRLHLLEDIIAVAKVITSRAGPTARGIGVGTTGHVDRDNGVLTRSINMEIESITIGEALAEATGLSVQVENDVHAATIGEIRLRGRTHKDFRLQCRNRRNGMVFNGGCIARRQQYAGENGHISSHQGATICRAERLHRKASPTRGGGDVEPAYLPRSSRLPRRNTATSRLPHSTCEPSSRAIVPGGITGDPRHGMGPARRAHVQTPRLEGDQLSVRPPPRVCGRGCPDHRRPVL